MPSLKDIRVIREETLSGKNIIRIELLKDTEEVLNTYGFSASIGKIEDALDNDPYLLGKLQQIYDVVYTNRATLVITNNTQILWDIYNYFPILFAVNNLGKSVYRVTVNNLMNKLLNKDALDRNLEMRQYLNLFSSIFFGDARMNSMAQSIEGVITQSIYTTYPKRVLITAMSPYTRKEEIVRDITHRLSTVYSPDMCAVVQQKAQLVILQEPVKPNSSWL